MNRKLVWFITHLRIVFRGLYSALHDIKFKATAGRKGKKTMGYITPVMGSTIPGMDRWGILILVLIFNVNQSNEQYIIWFWDVLASSRNIISCRLHWPEPEDPWFKRAKDTRTKNPSIKSQFYNALRHAPELKPHWKVVNTICLIPL